MDSEALDNWRKSFRKALRRVANAAEEQIDAVANDLEQDLVEVAGVPEDQREDAFNATQAVLIGRAGKIGIKGETEAALQFIALSRFAADLLA